ncbi:hypothetical protein PIB30_035168 [Stylosanthes scabra]|uniref:Uncharacterized protein n=1 Tax=Stylosanthes scabra TaxID=79078 RepID=A0ABU6YDD8_9FABA|nr:hypothetical protein [Stylosanthes scabra]
MCASIREKQKERRVAVDLHAAAVVEPSPLMEKSRFVIVAAAGEKAPTSGRETETEEEKDGVAIALCFPSPPLLSSSPPLGPLPCCPFSVSHRRSSFAVLAARNDAIVAGTHCRS